MRTLQSAAATAIASGNAALAMLIEMDFAGGTLRLTTAGADILDNDSPPNTWSASGLLGAVAAVEDKTRGDVSGISMEVSGVDPAIIAIALGEQVRGRPLALHLAILDATTHALLDVSQIWAGQMATMQISMQDQKASIKLSGEHRGVLFSRAKPLRYIDSDQQSLFPGDRCLEYVASQSQKIDVWPASSFFKV